MSVRTRTGECYDNQDTQQYCVSYYGDGYGHYVYHDRWNVWACIEDNRFSYTVCDCLESGDCCEPSISCSPDNVIETDRNCEETRKECDHGCVEIPDNDATCHHCSDDNDCRSIRHECVADSDGVKVCQYKSESV